jgi:hypothetical protein
MTQLRQHYPVLRYGRQYLRPVSFLGKPFAVYGPGEIVAWSRILDDEEALCVVNAHGTEVRGADVLVDAGLSGSGSMTVLLNTQQAAGVGTASPTTGSAVPVHRASDGSAFVSIRELGASEVVVLTNRP